MVALVFRLNEPSAAFVAVFPSFWGLEDTSGEEEKTATIGAWGREFSAGVGLIWLLVCPLWNVEGHSGDMLPFKLDF